MMTQLLIQNGEAVETEAKLPRWSSLSFLLGQFRRQQRKRERLIVRSHHSSPVHERVPMRVWRRKSAMLMMLYGEQDQVR